MDFEVAPVDVVFAAFDTNSDIQATITVFDDEVNENTEGFILVFEVLDADISTVTIGELSTTFCRILDNDCKQLA